MRFYAYLLGRIAFLTGAFVFISCGPNDAMRTKKFRELKKASDLTQLTQSSNQIPAKSRQTSIDPSLSLTAKTKPQNNLYPNENGEPYLASLPFYCNPFEYPPNIVLTIKACEPFTSYLYPEIGGGYGYARSGIQYRLKRNVGGGGNYKGRYDRYYYDDDNDNYRRRRYHR